VNAVAARSPRCGIDSVEVARVERMLADTPAADLSALFSADELRDAGDGPGRAGSLAARLAAKEACLKLFPRETALNTIAAPDFSVVRDVWGAPEVVCSPTAEAVRNRHRIARITLSMTHDRTNASAVALAEPAVTEVTLSGRLFYHLLPLRRRVIMANLRRVYGDHLPDAEITRAIDEARPTRDRLGIGGDVEPPRHFGAGAVRHLAVSGSVAHGSHPPG